MDKIFNKGLDRDDKKEGLLKRLKNIENVQKKLISGDDKNKTESILSKSEGEDENEKTARELYQDGIESMKGF